MKITAILIACLIGTTQAPALAASAEMKAPCRLEVDNAHLSSNIVKKEKKLAVKVIFRSICNFDQENLIVVVQIKKGGLVGDHAVTPPITRRFPFVNANQESLIQDIYVYCKNTKRTYFYGIAEAEAYVNEIRVKAPKAQSRKRVALECGT